MKDFLIRLWHRAIPRRQVLPPTQAQSSSPIAKKTQVEPAGIIRGERTLIVGVDFGTSSTKVIWQDLSDNKFEILAWFPGETSLRAFLFPSVMNINNSEISYGQIYDEKTKNGCRLSSIKLCVLCRNNPQICSCGNPNVQKGMVHLPGSDAIYPAAVLACMFIAHVFRATENALQTRFPNDDLVVVWNVGCPMDHLDVAKHKNEWETMTGVALQMHKAGMDLTSTETLPHVAASLDAFVVPAEGEQSFQVLPEGLAAVKAFLESAYAETKTYAIVDVGAGTTEVSFLFNGRNMKEQGHPLRPCYLADSTHPAGGLKIDSELAKAWNCSVDEARALKHRGGSDLPSLATVQKICSQYVRTCWEIVKGQKLTAANDKRFDLFVIGGGGRLHPLHHALRSQKMPGGFLLENARPLRPPKSLRTRLAVESDYDFLVNACGLASSLQWEYYPPHEVPPMAPLKQKPRIDPDEYYPK
jgi:Ethanolamine utilization protein EutJ (predicted chaperonin)